MAKVFLAVFLCMVGYCSAKSVDFNPCTGKKMVGKMTELEIVPCDEQPCTLHLGTNVTMKVHFTANEDSDVAKGVVHAKVAGFSVPFPLPNPDGCKDCNLTCPLKKGNSYVYINQLPVMKEYPKIDTSVTWELQDAKKQDLFCFVVSVRIR